MNFLPKIILATTLTVFSPAVGASALDLSGAMVVEYADREGNTGLNPGAGHGAFNFVQAILDLDQRFTGLTRGFARVAMGGGTMQVSEAWLAFDGLPYEGTLTIGKFQKPNGEPLLTAGLTYPALLFHTARNYGLKAAMERGAWNWEVGVTNHNPLSAVGTTISNSFAFSRPEPAAGFNGDNSHDVYGYLGWRDGGEWGSLNLNGTYTYGEFTTADRDLIAQLGVMDQSLRDTVRRHDRRTWNLAGDYTFGPWRFFGEFATSREADMRLRAYNISLARRFHDLEFVLGHDRLDNNLVNRTVGIPASWKRKRTSLSANYYLSPSVQFQAHYEFNTENLSRAQWAFDPDGLPNDGFILQTVVGF